MDGIRATESIRRNFANIGMLLQDGFIEHVGLSGTAGACLGSSCYTVDYHTIEASSPSFALVSNDVRSGCALLTA